MSGISLILNILKNAQGSSSSSSSSALLFHSHSLITASAAASAAAAYIAASKPFASRAIFGDGGISVAYCDAGAATAWNEDFIPILSSEAEIDKPTPFVYKEYPIELRPLLSAFQLRSLAITSLRSLLQFYLPLLEIHPPAEEEEDDDLLQDGPEENRVDLLTPFRNSLKQIARETSAVTIRRVLERLAVHYCSQRMAWKLLKDVSKSARRKAKRGMPAYLFLFNISRTTFRGHALGVASSWIVQLIMAVYRYFIRKPDDERENLDSEERIRLFWREVCGSTLKFSSSLIFASIGAGIGALFHPSIGQWIGSAVGDLAGPFILIIAFEKLHLQI